MTSSVCVLSLRCMTQCHVLSIMSDRAATEGSKYFELGQQPHEFFLTRNTCFLYLCLSIYGLYLWSEHGLSGVVWHSLVIYRSHNDSINQSVRTYPQNWGLSLQ